PTSKSVTYNTAIGTLPSTPTMTGYAFNGWYTSASGGTQINTGTIVLGDATVYAQWNINNYTVTFDGNGGGGHTPTIKSVNYNTAIGTLPSTPTMTGYTFAGWFTASTGGSQITTNTIVLGDAIVYAQWTINSYTITFNANGGTTASPTIKTVNYNTAIGTLATTSRTGYTFAGWFTASTGGSQITISTIVLGEATIYAQWIINTYTVSGNFGTNAAGATINVCGTNVTATSTGIFSTTRSYGSVCNTIAATRTNYTCSTTTNGPASLTTNVTNIAGSCSINTYTVSGNFGTNAAGATINVCGTNVTATSTGIFSTTRNYGDVCNTISATRTGYTCSTTTQGPASLTTNVTNIAGSCTLNTYTVSGNFGTNASGATINVCGTNQAATSTGIFSATRNYGSVCNTIAATRTNYTCSTTTQGPASLTANVTNIAGSCSANTQVVACTGKVANSSYNTASSITQTWNGTSWLPTNVAVYNTTASTTACRYACSTGYHTEDSGTSCISDTKSCTITNGTGIQTWSGGTRGSCVLSSCNSGYTATIDSCEKSSLMTNIIGYWDFDDGTGQITKDKLGNGNNLYVSNDSTDIGTWVTGKIGGGAYKLDGSGWLKTTGLSFSSPVKTVSFWFKLVDTVDTQGTFVSYENSSDLLKEDNLGQNNTQYGNSTYTTLYPEQYSSGLKALDTNWHFYSISKGTNTIICLDGICEYTGVDSTSGMVNPDTLDLNGGVGYGYGEFTGGVIMDELRMFSTSYTKIQLEQMYTDSNGTTVTIVDYNGAKRYSNGSYAASCEAYLNSTAYNSNGNGLYWIKYSSAAAIQVECDMVNGGYMKAFDWNRIDSGVTLTDFQSKMTLVYNTMTDFIESDTGSIRWSDYNASGDVLDYYANITLPNSGSLRLDLNYLGYSMDTSGTWFYVTDASGNEVNIVCSAHDITNTTYYDATTEQIYIPAYTCPYTTAGSWIWNQVYTSSIGSEIKKLNLTSFHADSGLGDYSKLYKMVLWVK
ncbi:MAG: InlB B-repeat-containing protein, partial [Candidatus Gracilibacteria bacterium]|nr:InlB B-repeat-containing protein [Candidatus Gracilibacteria bacterium]